MRLNVEIINAVNWSIWYYSVNTELLCFSRLSLYLIWMSVLWPPPLFPSFVLISKRRLSLEEPKIVYVCFVHPLAMPIENAPRCIVIYTEMAKKVCPRLRELVPVARGGQEAEMLKSTWLLSWTLFWIKMNEWMNHATLFGHLWVWIF